MYPSEARPPAPLTVRLTRGPPPRPVDAKAPAWARTLGPDGKARPDAALPEGGAGELPPGWWGSAAKVDDERHLMRTGLLLVGGTLVLVLFMGLQVGARPGSRNWDSFLRILALILGLAAATWFSVAFAVRRQEVGAFRRRAHSHLRFDPAGLDLSAIAAAVDTAISFRSPASVPRPPPPTCLAEWATPSEFFVVRLWRGVAGGLPMLELESSLTPDETAAVKGAIEAALYGVPDA